MDCAITSLFPAAGAPPPAGADAPAGSGAELAALFATLVAERGVAPVDAAEAHGPAETGQDLPGSLPQAEEGEQDAPVSTGGMPWWLTATPEPERLRAAVQDVSGQSMTPVGETSSEEVPSEPDRTGIVLRNATSAIDAQAIGAPAVPADPPDLTGAMGASVDAEATEAPAQASPAQPSPAQPAPPQAARALARALAVLEAAGQPAREHAPAAVVADAVTTPADPIARTSPNSDVPQAQTPPPVDPVSTPRASTQAAPVTASTSATVITLSAEAGTSDGGGSAFGQSPRHAEAPPVPASRALAPSEGAVEGFLPAHAGHGTETRPATTGPVLPQGAPAVAEHEAAVADQLVQAIRIRAGEGTGEARVRLNPEFLGEVRIELKITGDRVNAVLHVERDDVRQQIENGTPALRAALAAHGLDLEEVTVREDDSSRREGTPQERREPRERKRRREPTDTFELPD